MVETNRSKTLEPPIVSHFKQEGKQIYNYL